MHGFKSFADPVTIEFDRGITCVVGPNGSGKSNISDALRWVLGEQSPKMLRGGKMDEVIFAGTASRKSRGMAEVTLVIDNSDGVLPVDFSEVAIGRRMYRSGESEYSINGSPCRLRDIRELIMDTGIGVDGYSLIGQGKIAEIINGKPESRREIFEEAAGIVKYRSRKAETERKLESARQNLERVNDIIAELQERLGPLEKESEKAQRYLELSRVYREAETFVILKSVDELAETQKALAAQASDLSRQISREQQLRDEAEEQIRQLNLKSQEADRKDMEERQRMMEFSDRLGLLKAELRMEQERGASLEQNLHNNERELTQLRERLANEQTAAQEVLEKNKKLTEAWERVNKDLSEKNDVFIRQSARLKESESRAEELKSRLYELKMEISSKSAEAEGIKNLGESLRTRQEQLQNQADAAGEGGFSAFEVAEKREQLKELEGRLKEQSGGIQLSEDRIGEMSHRIDAAEAELSRVSGQYSEQSAAAKALSQLENSYEGYGGAVRFIMQAEELDGIFGTVGELITVPKGYETAVETVLGARMQNIICRDDLSAEQAIRLLKKNRAGRLTFLPLASLKTSNWRFDPGIFHEEGFLAAAAECVTSEKEYEKAVKYLLSGVVIVDTLEHASRISKKYTGCRYVTLEGELINPSGAITGGAYRKNSAGILDRRQRLNELEKSLKLLAAQKDRAGSELEALKAEAERERTWAEKLHEERRQTEMRVINCKNELSLMEERLSQSADRRDRMSREMERIKKERNDTELSIQRLNEERSEAENLAERFEAEAEEAISQSECFRCELETLGGEITQLRLSAESLKGELAGNSHLVELSGKSADDINQQILEKEGASGELHARIQESRRKATETEEEIKCMENSDEAGSARLDAIRAEREEITKSLAKLANIRDEKEKELFEWKSSRREIEMRAESAAERAENLKNRLWEEFELAWLEAAAQKARLTEKFPDPAEATRQSKKAKRELREIGDVNVGSIAEYESVSTRFQFLTEQRNDLTEAEASLRKIIEDTDRRIRSDFQSTFDQIREHFKSTFSELFGGGRAEIILEDPADPLGCAIDIVAQPPGKKLQNMNLMSGGEKTMTAIALMFAVLKTKPTPFCILDEVEAALDEANIERFADYLSVFKDIQFVLVTHQKVTMEHANVLYGVTMPEKGISKILSLKLADAERMAEIAE